MHNRRKFITTTAAGSAALFLSPLDTLASTRKTEYTMNNKAAGLKIMATNWGFAGTMDQFCAKAKQSGYDGVELWWPLDKSKQDEMFAAVKKHGLELGFLCGGGQANPSAHLDFFKKMIDAAAKQTIQRPLYINSHSGKDYFTMEENGKFIDYTEKLAKETGLLICHETHRGRMLYSGPLTKEYLRRHPSLKLTLDISHWCCVHESMLGDQQETVKMALESVEHIHARIGHPEGPQVNDPRAPEWAKIVEQHLKWWDVVVARKKKKGETVTFLTEFGPPDYLPTMPYTKMPLADLWEVNAYMMQLLRKRYS